MPEPHALTITDALYGEIIALRVIVERLLVQAASNADALRAEHAIAVEHLSHMEIENPQSARTLAIRGHASAVLDEVYGVAGSHKGSLKR